MALIAVDWLDYFYGFARTFSGLACSVQPRASVSVAGQTNQCNKSLRLTLEDCLKGLLAPGPPAPVFVRLLLPKYLGVFSFRQL